MDEPFFPFPTNLPKELNTLGKGKLEEEFLTDDIEDEYDALNDQTFGLAADDGDWEEGHDKFTELVGRKESPEQSTSHLSSFFDASLLDGDDSHEIVSKSISQLGLEDDLDDPAIMTVGNAHSSSSPWPLDPVFRSSPPPPAIIHPEVYGKTHSIWSTNHVASTPARDSGISSLFPSLSSNNLKLSSSSDASDAFSSPTISKAWTLEEIEKNFHSSPIQPSSTISGWPKKIEHNHLVEPLKHAITPSRLNHQPTEDRKIASPPLATVVCPGVRTLDDVEKDILSKQSGVTDGDKAGKNSAAVRKPMPQNQVWPPLMRPRVNVPLRMPPGLAGNFPFPVPPVIPRLGQNAPRNFLAGSRIMPNANLLIHPNKQVLPYLGRPIDNRFSGWPYPVKQRPMFYPTSVLDPQTMNLMFGHQRRMPFCVLPGNTCDQMADNWSHHEPRKRTSSLSDDDYTGLMTNKEKDWLIRIQHMLIQTDNPYVEDYYYSTFFMRKCVQEALRNKDKSPNLILPERSTKETKAYVPAQFEGSLGKLQAVSVNFPRKLIDATVSRTLEDEEGRVVTNQSLMKYRRLLIDIEKLYNYLLEIDDEEKRILALPDQAHLPHRETIEKLTDKLFTGLGCENVLCDDVFQNIMTVRKGRNLGIRAFQIFSREQQLHFLTSLFRCFTTLLRKDINDHVFLKNVDLFTNFIQKLSMPELILVGESLENLPRSDTITGPSVKEKSHYIAALKNKFGSTIVCCILEHAENIYSGSEIQPLWAKVVLHIADIFCALPDASIVQPLVTYVHSVTHFQRFAIDRDKFEVLEKKLKLLEVDVQDKGAV